jgi:AcrR family transcriptional regulator
VTVEDVGVAAVRIADRDGLEAMTLTAVAAELGIKTPSLYNHIEGLDGLKRLVAIEGSRVLLGEFESASAGLEGVEALRAIADADRRFAIAHPGMYDSFLPAPTEDEDPDLYNEMAAPVFHVAHILLGMGIPPAEAIHLIRALRALLHGFLDLEAQRGFGTPVDIDASFEASIEMVLAGIEAAVRK